MIAFGEASFSNRKQSPRTTLLLSRFRFATFIFEGQPLDFRWFDAAAVSRQSRAQRDLVMYNWCGLAEEGEEEREAGECVERPWKNGNKLKWDFFFPAGGGKEGSKR